MVVAADCAGSAERAGLPGAGHAGEYTQPLSAAAHDFAVAQASGMSAENDRRSELHADILPLSAEYGTTMDLSPVPTNMVPPTSLDL